MPNHPEPFIHPVVRAIPVHLWLAYDHPFEDGERTHRPCPVLLGHGISGLLACRVPINQPSSERRSAQYRRSFLLTETDNLDATYLLHNLAVIVRAIDELHARNLRTKMAELRAIEEALRRSDLNHRQLALLGNALRHPDADYTYASHATSHRVARQSARHICWISIRKGLVTQVLIGRIDAFPSGAGLGAPAGLPFAGQPSNPMPLDDAGWSGPRCMIRPASPQRGPRPGVTRIWPMWPLTSPRMSPSAQLRRTARIPAAPVDDETASTQIVTNGEPLSAGCTQAQLRRFIKSRPYVPMHELRRRFELNGEADEVSAIPTPQGVVYVGLPYRESRFIAELVRNGDIGFELSHDPAVAIVIGIYAMRPVSR